jgi:hypothetical protein
VSFLTKTFVVLLVVLSLVETAGIVVYVNRAQHFSKALTDERNATNAAKADAAAKDAAANMAEIARQNAEANANNIRNSSQQTIDGLRASNLEKDTQIAQLNANVQQLTAAQKSSGDAVLVAQKTLDSQNQQMADLRKANLQLQQRDSENSLALVSLNNKFDTVNRQWRDATEQNSELQNQLKNANETMHRTGVSTVSPTLNPEALVRVEGVVRKTQNLNGIPMATISIGSADQITKGMRLSVIDPHSNEPFLGYLWVERVEPNEAIGRLEGPRVNQIHAGVEVRTQL